MTSLPAPAAMAGAVDLDDAFDQVAADFDHLLTCFRRLLEEEGATGQAVAAALAGPDGSGGTGPLAEDQRDEHWLAITVWFHLLNLAESEWAVRQRFHAGAGPWLQLFQSWRQQGDLCAECLRHTRIEPVLTAHPTQAEPVAVLRLRRRLRSALRAVHHGTDSHDQSDYDHGMLQLVIDQLWHAGATKELQPTVADELEVVIDRLAGPIPQALARTDRRLRRAWRWADGDEDLLDDLRQWPQVRFGTWVGGDRDGHDGVDAATTAASLRRLRQAGLELLADRLSTLAGDLVLSSSHYPPPIILEPLLKDLDAPERPVDRPWARAAEALASRCRRAASAGAALDEERLADDLARLQESLAVVGAGRLGRELVWPVRRHLAVFGADLADLDIRQNSTVHDQAVQELYGVDLSRADETERRRLALERLRDEQRWSFDESTLSSATRDLITCYRNLAVHRDQHRSGLGALIVSMTRDVSDLLHVHVLALAAGFVVWKDGCWRVPLPVVPLFETADDLHRAPAVVDAYLSLPVAGEARRGGLQVMIGYSDSNKDAGFFTARWAQHNAIAAIAAAAERHGIQVRFFHGRGGTPSRGAIPWHRFMAALPGGVDHRQLRFTEQGEVIEQHYGDLAIAADHLELVLAAAAERGRDAGIVPDQEHRHHGDRLAAATRKHYRRLVDDARFAGYWRHATPVDILEHCCIGSRPTKRFAGGGLDLVRAIPWVFGWMQNRHYLTAWYGFGSAWQELTAADGDAASWWRQAIDRWPFWRTLVRDMQQGWASADLAIAGKYAALAPDPDTRSLFDDIASEHQRTGDALADLCGGDWLAQRPRLIHTITLRRAPLQRLHDRQVELLARWRADGSPRDGQDLDELVASVNALTAGLRSFG